MLADVNKKFLYTIRLFWCAPHHTYRLILQHGNSLMGGFFLSLLQTSERQSCNDLQSKARCDLDSASYRRWLLFSSSLQMPPINSYRAFTAQGPNTSTNDSTIIPHSNLIR